LETSSRGNAPAQVRHTSKEENMKNSTKKQVKQSLRPPTMRDLEDWVYQGYAEAACPHGCIVEPDGHCPHGKPSWLLKLGLI
jgi:hypothetical protein